MLHWLGKTLLKNLLRLGQVEPANGSARAEAEENAVVYLALLWAAADAEEAEHIEHIKHVVMQALLEKFSKLLSCRLIVSTSANPRVL